MPEKARIFWVEDDQQSLEEGKEFAEELGHQVILVATTLDQALNTIPSLEENRIEVAVVDGNLDDWNKNGRDGRVVVKAIKDQFPEVGIIGNSGSGRVEGADFQVPKSRGGEALAKAITAIPYPFRRINS